MKKTIAMIIAVMITMVSMAQKSDSTKKAESFKISTGSNVMARTSGTDTLVIEKVKYLKIGDKVFNVADLASPDKITLFVPFQWIIANYQYLDVSSGGLSKKQVEEMQTPLLPYYQYYLQLVQQQQQKQQGSPPNKQ